MTSHWKAINNPAALASKRVCVFTDGSAFATRLGSMATAGAAAVLSVPGQQEPVALIESSMPAGCDMTSQAGEFLGSYLGNLIANVVAKCRADCQDLCGVSPSDP